jgi:hypothetical protein
LHIKCYAMVNIKKGFDIVLFLVCESFLLSGVDDVINPSSAPYLGFRRIAIEMGSCCLLWMTIVLNFVHVLSVLFFLVFLFSS